MDHLISATLALLVCLAAHAAAADLGPAVASDKKLIAFAANSHAIRQGARVIVFRLGAGAVKGLSVSFDGSQAVVVEPRSRHGRRAGSPIQQRNSFPR